MEIADKIYQQVKTMSVERANKVLEFIKFLEFKYSKHEHVDETDYILNNASLMQQIDEERIYIFAVGGHYED